MRTEQPAIRRVLMTADTVGGVWTYALELARGLREHSVEVALATMGGPPHPWQRQEARALSNLELFESGFKLEWMGDPWKDLGEAGEWLLQLEARVGPDVVHLNGYVHAALPWPVPVLLAGHSCVLSWWKAVRGGAAPPLWDRYREAVACGLAAADLVVCPTAAMLRVLHETYPGAICRARVIPNGRDPELFRPALKEDFVLAAGRLWDEAKNIALLEDAAISLGWPVYVAGEETHPDGRQAHFGNLIPLGPLTPGALAEYYGRASIYALPARYEPFGLTVLEAAQAGCALVLGDIPSLRENWDGAALFVCPNDAGALAAALEELIADPWRRARWQARARRRALNFTPRRMAGAYLSAYRDLRRPVAEPTEAVCTS